MQEVKMAQLTIDDLLVWSEAVRRAYGGDVPLWMAYQKNGPSWPSPRTATTLVPVEHLCLSDSADSPAMFVLGPGMVLPSLPEMARFLGVRVAAPARCVCPGLRPAFDSGAACCTRAGQYNGFGSDGPRSFVCPISCPCHD